MKNIKVSNCCGAKDMLHSFKGENDKMIDFSDMELCPFCGEHCTFISEEDYDTPLEDSGELENQQDEND